MKQNAVVLPDVYHADPAEAVLQAEAYEYDGVTAAPGWYYRAEGDDIPRGPFKSERHALAIWATTSGGGAGRKYYADVVDLLDEHFKADNDD